MLSKHLKSNCFLSRNDVNVIKGLFEPAYSDKGVSITSLSNSRLPIRRNIFPAGHFHDSKENICAQRLSAPLDPDACLDDHGAALQKKDILNKVKILVSRQGSGDLLKAMYDFCKIRRQEEYKSLVGYKSHPTNPFKYCRHMKIKISDCHRKRKEGTSLIKRLIKECHKIRILLNEKVTVNDPQTHSNEHLTTKGSKTQKNLRNQYIIYNKDIKILKEGQKKEFWNRYEDPNEENLDLSKNGCNEALSDIKDGPYNHKNRGLLSIFKIKREKLFTSSSLCAPVLAPHSPKLRIMYTNSVLHNTDRLSEQGNEGPTIEANLGCKDDDRKNHQANNSNSNGGGMSTHKYFRHAQQLLSSNSSQMQSIVYGTEDSRSLKSKPSFLSPFRNGSLAETQEDVSFLQQKLDSNVACPNDNRMLEKTGLPFDRLIDREMSKEEISLIMTHNQERKPVLGPSLSEFQVRRQKERCESQEKEYRNMSAQFRQIKSEHGSAENVKAKIMQSPEIMKNNKIVYPDLQRPLQRETPEISDEYEIREKSYHKNSYSENIPRMCNKKVCFNIDSQRIPGPESNLPGGSFDDCNYYLDQQIQGINMTLGNVIRRMNNLEMHFQDFSTLFIKLHKETFEIQKKKCITGQCCNFPSLDCNGYM